jgi:hypothetical protein
VQGGGGRPAWGEASRRPILSPRPERDAMHDVAWNRHTLEAPVAGVARLFRARRLGSSSPRGL